MANVDHVTCPCCGHLAFQRRGDYEICPICFWEDDLVQIADPWFRGGANKPNLFEAQRNYSEFGATERRYMSNVRLPNVSVDRPPQWRPVIEIDRERATTPRQIEEERALGKNIPYEYWLRAIVTECDNQ